MVHCTEPVTTADTRTAVLRRRLAALSATLAVVAVACGGATEVATDAGATAPDAPSASAPGDPTPEMPAVDPTPGEEVSATAPSSDPAGPAANAEVLSFTASAVGGGTVDGVEYAGGDVVLWIWAPW